MSRVNREHLWPRNEWHIITFPNIFLGREDKDLLRKLTTEEELSGFLNWCLEGLKRLKDNAWKLSGSKSLEETRQEYVRKSDPIQAFVMDCCTVQPENEIAKDTLYENFKKYCQAHKLPSAHRDQFFRKLSKYATVTTTRPMVEGKRIWSIKGLMVKDGKDWGKDDETEEAEDKTLYELVLAAAARLTRENDLAKREDLEVALSGKLTPEQIDGYMAQIVKDGLADVLDWGKWRTVR
jgi:phage/plasmid-associated DNA primase